MFIRTCLLFFATLLLLLPTQAQIASHLLAAIERNDVRAVEAALKAGANPNATDSLGATPLMWACFRADTAVVELLVKRGAKTACKGVIRADSSTYYGNLTGLAAGLNKFSLLRYLLETLKLPVNQPEYNPKTNKNDGWTPTEWAASNGHLAVLTYLTKFGADLVVGKGNPIALATSRKQTEIVAFLLEQGLMLDKDHPRYFQMLAAYFKQVHALETSYEKQGQYSRAASLCEHRRAICAEAIGTNNAIYATILNNLGGLYAQLGQYQKALRLYPEALAIIEKAQGRLHPNYANTLNNLALIHKAIGKYEKALPLYLECLTIQGNSRGRLHEDYAGILNNLALLYEAMGQYEKALPLYIEALAITERVQGKFHPDYATKLNNLAEVYKSIGQYEKALPLYLDCLTIRENAQDRLHPDYATTLNNLAELYRSMEQYEKALPLYLDCLTIREKALGRFHPAYATTLNNLGGLYAQLGQYKKSLPLYLDCLTIQEKTQSKLHPNYAGTLNNLAGLYRSMEQYEKALPLYLEALTITEKTLGRFHPDYANTLNNLAVLYAQLGQYEKAVPLYSQARQQYRSQLLSQIAILNETTLTEYQTKFDIQECVYSLAFTSHTQALAGEHYNDALLSKGIGLMASQQLNNLLTRTTDTLAARIFVQLRGIKQSLNRQYTKPIKQQRGVDSLQQVARDLEQQLLLRLPEYRKAFTALAIEWQQVQQAIKPDEAAIEFMAFNYYHKLWTDSTLYAAIVLRPGWSMPRFVYLSEQRQFDSLLTAGTASPASINGLYRGGKVEGNSSQLARGVALSKLIWQPLDSLLQGVRTVVVAPAGRLHQIALAALPDPADTSHRTCMADRFQIRQVGSTRMVALRNTQSERPLAAQTLHTSLYGGITYDTDSMALARQVRRQAVQHTVALREATRSGEWTYLPGTQTEVDNLRQLIPAAQTTYLVKEAATEASVKALSGQAPTILHIATHGFFFPDLVQAKSDQLAIGRERTQFEVSENPLLRSGLVMAGANYVWKGGTPIDGVDDGILTAYEVANLDLRGTELVVLSACETALGKVQGSEGVYGLQRAFKMAGARYLLMSLWRVSDQETADYMALFYSHLLKAGSVSTAYEYAQKQMRSRFPNEPFKWAAFVLVE